MRLRAAVLGDAVVDVHVSGTSPRVGSDVPAAIRLEPGGQGANLAVRLARRGVDVRLGCSLADDAAGRMLRERLTADGVEMMVAPAERTGAVVVLVDADGERSMLSQRVPLTPALDAVFLGHLVGDLDWLAVSGYVLLEPDAEVLARSLVTTPARRVVIGCALRPVEAARWHASAAACRPSLLVLNADEAATVAGTTDPADAAARLAKDLAPAVVVTQTGGATAVIDGRQVTASGQVAEEAVDTTGAGDAFAAALLATIGRDHLTARILEAALTAAVQAGSAATRVIGAQGRIPGERDADRLHS